jgi:tRNA uracil 4-sulfurtransferase
VKAVLLLSGGIDSPVAGHLIAQKGVELVALHLSIEPFTDSSPQEKAQRLARKLGLRELYVTNQAEAHSRIVKECDHRYYYVLTRRLLLRVAERFAAKMEAQALVTGENLGQVGSQTLSNMATITAAVSMPVWRPLLCNDKTETMALARQIGTMEMSTGPELCSVLGPASPATRSNPDEIAKMEAALPMEECVHALTECIQRVSL